MEDYQRTFTAEEMQRLVEFFQILFEVDQENKKKEKNRMLESKKAQAKKLEG